MLSFQVLQTEQGMKIIPDFEGLVKVILPIGAFSSIRWQFALLLVDAFLFVEDVFVIPEGQEGNVQDFRVGLIVNKPILLIEDFALFLQVFNLLDLLLDGFAAKLKLFL